MDPILQVLLSWQFVLFSLAVAAVVYVFRIIFEYILTLFKIDPTKPVWWNDLILPIFPVFVGAFGAVKFNSFPYPDGLTTHGDRLIFGLVAGLLSTLLYRVFKSLLYQKIQTFVQSLPGATPTPPTPSAPPPCPPEPPTAPPAPPAPPVNPAPPNANLPPRGQL